MRNASGEAFTSASASGMSVNAGPTCAAPAAASSSPYATSAATAGAQPGAHHASGAGRSSRKKSQYMHVSLMATSAVHVGVEEQLDLE